MEISTLTSSFGSSGYAVASQLIDPVTTSLLHDRLFSLALTDTAKRSPNERVWDLPGRTACFDRLIMHPVATTVAGWLLDDDYHVVEACGHLVHPGAPKQYLHSDQNPAPTPWRDATVMTAVWMIDDFELGNGAIEVVPGSHRKLGPPRYGRGLPRPRVLRGRAGSVVLLDGRTWHQAGSNETSSCRCSVIVTYGREFVARSPQLTLLDDVAARLAKASVDR